MTLLLGNRHDWGLHAPQRPSRPSVSLALVGPMALLTATAIGWKAFENTRGDEATAGLALFMGSVSILCMTWSNLLATRWRGLEPWFGGLDRMYRWHRWFGAAAVIAMWLHIQIVDDVKGIAGASRSVADQAEDLAGTAQVLLYILVTASLLRWLPYRWWRLTHKALVVPYALACWHFYTATKPFGNGEAWGRWFSALMVVGLLAWTYRVVWRDLVRRGAVYAVRSLRHDGTLIELVLAPRGRRHVSHRPGQFVFLSPHVRGLTEPHPFTIASPPDQGELVFHIRQLGDWTDRLAERLEVGALVTVEGPYGRLHPRPRRSGGPVVWIAGGVGITPFLAAATTSPTHGGPGAPHLFYAVRSRHDAPALQALEAAADEGRIVLHLHASEEGSRLRSHDLTSVFGPSGLVGAHVVMCGPGSLVRDMTSAVRALGATRVHVEQFDLRSGLGPDLSRALAHAWPATNKAQVV